MTSALARKTTNCKKTTSTAKRLQHPTRFYTFSLSPKAGHCCSCLYLLSARWFRGFRVFCVTGLSADLPPWTKHLLHTGL